jgi:hypothetical protein
MGLEGLEPNASAEQGLAGVRGWVAQSSPWREFGAASAVGDGGRFRSRPEEGGDALCECCPPRWLPQCWPSQPSRHPPWRPMIGHRRCWAGRSCRRTPTSRDRPRARSSQATTGSPRRSRASRSPASRRSWTSGMASSGRCLTTAMGPRPTPGTFCCACTRSDQTSRRPLAGPERWPCLASCSYATPTARSRSRFFGLIGC